MSARLPWWIALPCAVLGGLALDAATPWLEWWSAGFVGTAAILAAVWQQRLWHGLGLGLIAGAAFWLPHIHWLTLYLGPVPWLALSTVMILWFGLFGLFAAVATRGLARLPMPPGVRIAAQSLAVAGLWVIREVLQSSWPYGGFAWGRLAHTQAESPLVALVSWIGFTGLSALMVVACAVPVAFAFAAFPSSLRRGVRLAPRLRQAGLRGSVAAGCAVLVLAGLSVIPAAQLSPQGSLSVAAVQGNSQSGIFDDRENGDVFRAHLRETERMLDEIEQRGEQVDVIVWPENSAEFELPSQPLRMRAIESLAHRAGAPVVVGTILAEDGRYTNSTIVVGPGGAESAVPVAKAAQYDKRRPVPFAEYMPNRDFFHALAPDLVDLVQLEYTAGTLDSVLEIQGASDVFRAGIAICFDIIFDDHAVAMMTERGGAQVIFAQTNNADFGHTDQSAQQLQIARLRAVETGRALINISTVGTSAVVGPDGTDLATLTPHTASYMVATVPLVSGVTPALLIGDWITALWMLVGAAGGVGGAFVLLRKRVHR